MPDLSRNARVLRFLVEQAPGVGRTHLLKFAYMADIEARQLLGRPVTGFRYIRYNYGPFDQGFYTALDELQAAGLLREEKVELANGYVGSVFRTIGPAIDYGFAPAEAELLGYVAELYLPLSARELCDEIVYQTAPMKSNTAMNAELPMEELNFSEQHHSEFNLERMLQGETSARSGRFRPLSDAVRELQARNHP